MHRARAVALGQVGLDDRPELLDELRALDDLDALPARLRLPAAPARRQLRTVLQVDRAGQVAADAPGTEAGQRVEVVRARPPVVDVGNGRVAEPVEAPARVVLSDAAHCIEHCRPREGAVVDDPGEGGPRVADH